MQCVVDLRLRMYKKIIEYSTFLCLFFAFWPLCVTYIPVLSSFKKNMSSQIIKLNTIFVKNPTQCQAFRWRFGSGWGAVFRVIKDKIHYTGEWISFKIIDNRKERKAQICQLWYNQLSQRTLREKLRSFSSDSRIVPFVS